MAEWAHKEATWIPRIVFKEKFWNCPECQEANFAWRTECNNCGAPGVAVELVGPSFPENKLVDAIKKILNKYKKNKKNKSDDFLSVFKRIGIKEFKKDLYDNTSQKK